MPELDDLRRPNTFEIDLDAITANVAEIRRFVGPDVRIFVAMKANAYGFGLLEVAPVLEASGVDTVCVADLSDAVRLRDHGISIPILLYAGNLVDDTLVRTVEERDFLAPVTDLDMARRYSTLARKGVRVLAKVDVGLERLGIPAEDATSGLCAIAGLPRIELAGVYTHLHAPSPGGPPDYLRWQLARFSRIEEEVRAAGVWLPVATAASTPVLPYFGAAGLNGIDVGRLVYGSLRADRDATSTMHIRSAFKSLRSRLIQCRQVHRTEYLREAPFPIRSGMRIGIAPIGYADGLDSLNCGFALVRGCRAPLVASPSLEHTRLDLTGVPGAEVGDEVVFVGAQGELEITPDDVLRHLSMEQPARMANSVRESVRRVYWQVTR